MHDLGRNLARRCEGKAQLVAREIGIGVVGGPGQVAFQFDALVDRDRCD
ncbi:hypothetical protein [Ramlibacter albus]|uniref:Uncharacterized protein n=1 Tax=Ramlibacter albus TaxID=2079448 RepID=A0A923M5K0_9BURK|nr:hypothetical protein [Ramlibacter albus]MBC5764622.1 hypothetical protein [Ramlibacter albus]